TVTRSLRILAANNHRCAVVDAPCCAVSIPRRACPPWGRPPFPFWRFAMSLIVHDSCVESRFAPASQSEDWIIQEAIALLEQRVFKAGPILDRPQAVKDYLRLKLVAEPNEVFAIVFMNSQHR